MSWEFHPACSSFAQHAADWDRLNGELYGGHPCFDSHFVGPLLKYFGSGRERLCLYRRQGVVQAALILQPRGGGRWATFRPAQAQITPLLVGDADLLNDLFTALPGFAWSIEFHAVDPRYAPIFSYAQGRTIVSEHYTTIGINPEIGFEAYWSQRSRNLRGNIRRYCNRLKRETMYAELLSIKVPLAMADGVRRFGELESAGWKAATGAPISIESVEGQFFAEVLANFGVCGQAEICELLIGGKLAASSILIVSSKMLVILTTTYDETLARYSPNWLLLRCLIEKHFTERPGAIIEFYINAGREQAAWASFHQVIQNIRLFRNDAVTATYTLAKAPTWHRGRPEPSRETLDKEPPVEVGCSANIDDFAKWEDSLGQFPPCASIEESLAWFGLLQCQVYPDDRGVRYYYVVDRDQLMSIMPMRQSKRGRVRVLESLSNYYTSLYTPLLRRDGDSKVLGHMLEAATLRSGGVDVMRFAPMDPDSPTYTALLEELRAAGWIPLTFFCYGNWFLRVQDGWENYLRTRSGSLRSNIKRANRDFGSEGGALEVVTSPARLEEAIADYEEVYEASWKKPEPYPEFVPSLMRLLAAQGMLRLGIARLRGRPIAAQLWIVGHGKASIYKVAYREDYSKYSPGRVLTSYLMRHVIEVDRVREVDYLIGDDEYKKVWMSHRRERWGILAFNRSTAIGCALLAKEVAGRLVKSAAGRLRDRLMQSRALRNRMNDAVVSLWKSRPRKCWQRDK